MDPNFAIRHSYAEKNTEKDENEEDMIIQPNICKVIIVTVSNYDNVRENHPYMCDLPDSE